MENIVITNIQRVSMDNYKVYFTSNFDIDNLNYEVSVGGGIFQSPVALTSFTSPQIINIPSVVDFDLRLSSNYIAPIPPETGFLMINSNDKFLINSTDSLKYTN